MVKQSRQEIQQEFEAFSAKIARLEALRHELDSLDTTSFEKEAKAIRSRLKDITALPFLERSLESLKAKITARSTPPLTVSVIPTLQRRIRTLERTIAEKKTLSKNDAHALREIPHLERALSTVQKQLASHLRTKGVKVDSGIGVLVDTTFDEFVHHLKSELTERLREREISMDAQMRADLASRESLFSQRYQSLVQELHEKYRARLAHEVHQGVQVQLGKELQQRLAFERKKLATQLLRQHARRLEEARTLQVRTLAQAYALKEKKLKEQLSLEEQRHARIFAEKQAELHRRIGLLVQREQASSMRSAQLRRRITAQRHLLQAEQRRLRTTRASFQREALRKAMVASAASRERSLTEIRALRQQLALQKHHLMQHMQELRTRERLVAQEETHSRLQLVHEKEVLAHALDALHQREAGLTARARARYLTQRAALHERALELQKREKQLAHTLAEAQNAAQAERAGLMKQLTELKEHTAHALAHERALAQAHERAMRVRLRSQARQQVKEAKRRADEARQSLTHLLSQQKASLREKMRSVQTRERSLTTHDALLKATVSREKERLQAAFSRLVAHQRKALAQIQHHAREKIARQSRQHAQQYAQQLHAERQKMHQELSLRVSAQRADFERQVHQQVVAQTARIKANLEAEYAKRIQVTLAQRQAELEKKKVALERHVLSQAKKLFH